MDDCGPNSSSKSSGSFERLRPVFDELEEAYWVPVLATPFEPLRKLVAALEDDTEGLYLPLLSFKASLEAAKELLDFPYMLLAPLLADADLIAKVRAARTEPSASDLPESLHEAIAHAVFSGSRKHLLRRPELQRLMHQACLLAWSAFETFCKDVFIASVNQRPDLYPILQRSIVLRERFSVGQGAWSTLLERHGYDLKGKLGTVIAADKDFSSPALIACLFTDLFAGLGGDPGLMNLVDLETLKRLGLRRNLIAHRCGIVDVEYLRKTQDQTQQAGELLKLRGRDVGEAFMAVANAASALYGFAHVCWA